eukprot:514641_1
MAALSTVDRGLQPKTVYAGVLNKKGAVNKAWKKRWFILYENRRLVYYASQTAVINDKEPINCIDLSTISAIRVVNKPVNKTASLQPRHPRTLSKSQSIGNLFSRMKSKSKLTVNGSASREKSLGNLSVGDVLNVQFAFTSEFSFELVSPKRTYTLCCEHAASFNEWIDNLESAVFGKKLFTGWMTKQGHTRKTWKRRWFIIFDTCEMRYYVDDKREEPKGSVLLTDVLTMRMVSDGIKYDEANILELHTTNRIWVLSADTKQERTLWWHRIASVIPQSHQFSPIYEDNLFTLDTGLNAWIYRYFALDSHALYQFDKIEDCETYTNCTYFDDGLYRHARDEYVECIVSFTQHPIIQRITPQHEEFNQFKKPHLFKIKTDMFCYYFCTDDEVQIDRWFSAFKKLIKMRGNWHKKHKKSESKAIFSYVFGDADDDDEADRCYSHVKSQTVRGIASISAEKYMKGHERSSSVRRRTPLKRRIRKRTLLASHPDMSIVSALLALGFTSVNACKRAALAVNNISCEMAANWLWSNMERADIHEPLVYSDDDKECDEFEEEDSENDMEYLTEREMKEIEDIPEYGVVADTFFRYKIWNKALSYYCKALDKHQLMKRKSTVDDVVYKWYCYRSECYRRVHKYPEAVRDTMTWMDMVFNDDAFDFVQGCEIASGIWIDLKRFNAAMIPIQKGLQMNEKNPLLKRRLARAQRGIEEELEGFALEIDRKHLENEENVINNGLTVGDNAYIKGICDGWMQMKLNVDPMKRLAFIMRVYGTWCTAVTQTDETEFVSMYDILCIIDYMEQLVIDYIHLLDAVHHELKSKCLDCFSKEIAVAIYDRHTHRDRQLYFGYTESPDVMALQILDNVHSVLFSSDHMSFISKHRETLPRNAYSKYVTHVSPKSSHPLHLGTDKMCCVKPKYGTLKEELLDNDLSTLQWKDVLCKAKWFAKAVQWKARKSNEEWKIRRNQPICVTHLVVLLLYTNDVELRSVSQQRRHFDLILRQCVALYSTQMSPQMRFYHAIKGMNRFNEYVLKIGLQIKSLSKHYSVAMMSENDMVLSLKLRDSTSLFHLDVTYLSNAPFEGECIVQDVEFAVCNVYLAPHYIDYDVWMHSLLLFSKMVNGQYLLHTDYEFEQRIVQCMDHMMDPVETDAPPKYIQMMFEYLIRSTRHLYLIKSQYEHLSDDIWSRLLMIDKRNNKYRFGNFLSFWKANNLRCAEFVNEYKWNEEDMNAFWSLKDEDQLIGPQLVYPQQNLTFVTVCKRLQNVAQFAIKCKRFPDDSRSIYMQYNLFCPQAQHAISKHILITEQNNYQCTNVPMNTINAFQFQIALRIIDIA